MSSSEREALLANVASVASERRATQEPVEYALTPEIPRILVADDEPQLRSLLRVLLPRHGLAVWAVEDGVEAVRVFAANRGAIRAALLDVQLPGRDGPATLEALRAVDPALPCCFMTAHPGRHTEAALLALGAARVFPKPLPVAELVATLRQLCRVAS